MRLNRLPQLVFLTLIASALALSSANSLAKGKKVSGKAKDFTLSSNTGKNIRLSDLKGKVVMINFWASWCGPCRQEFPLLDDMYKRYQPAGFELLGVNIEPKKKDADKLLKQIPVTFPILYDTEQKVSELYDVSAMPTTILIDKNGKMRYLAKGYKPGYEKDYKEQVKALLKE